MVLQTNTQKILSDIHTSDTLAVANIEAVIDLDPKISVDCELYFCSKGKRIVEDGNIIADLIKDDVRFEYSTVPLGIIIKGNITVLNTGKGVRRLEAGDFIGLFETGDWIVNKRTRNIGDWTLVADNDVTILFFNETSLSGNNKKQANFKAYISSLVRLDETPKPVSDLPILDWVASHTTSARLSDCAIIAHTHIFPTSVSLFKHLTYLVGTENIFILDKPYSSIQGSINSLVKSGAEVTQVTTEAGVPYESSLKKAVDLMWGRVLEAQKNRGFKKILIIDDGGDLWLSIPWSELEKVQIAGVEQTQRGITRIQDSSVQFPPIVSVASSGVKKIVESDFIGTAVVAKLKDLKIFDKVSSVGVLGTGSIGLAVIESLKEIGINPLSYDTTTHDKSSNLAGARDSVDSLIRDSDLIIGTTGQDSTRGVVLDRVTGTKIFVSASSADIEFHSILKLAPCPKDPFQTVSIPFHEDLTINILNGGFPINFDREKEWEPTDDIAITRCLLYIGIMQAAQILINNDTSLSIYTLDQTAQEKTLNRWLENKELKGVSVLDKYKDVEKIVQAAFLKDLKSMPTVWTN